MVSSSSEDFSFPKISNPLPHFEFSSPYLWRVSSVIYPDYGHNNEEGDRDNIVRKSFSSFVAAAVTDHHHQVKKTENIGGDDLEKMDVLWENFNELDLQRVSSKIGHSGESWESESGREPVKQSCCTVKKDLKVSKPEDNGGGRSMKSSQPKRGRFVRVLKKVLSLGSSSSSSSTKK